MPACRARDRGNEPRCARLGERARVVDHRMASAVVDPQFPLGIGAAVARGAARRFARSGREIAKLARLLGAQIVAMVAARIVGGDARVIEIDLGEQIEPWHGLAVPGSCHRRQLVMQLVRRWPGRGHGRRRRRRRRRCRRRQPRRSGSRRRRRVGVSSATARERERDEHAQHHRIIRTSPGGVFPRANWRICLRFEIVAPCDFTPAW